MSPLIVLAAMLGAFFSGAWIIGCVLLVALALWNE